MIDLNNHLNSVKSILCLNGEIPSKDFFIRHLNLPLIAADGAANALVHMGIIPALIVGDLDSIDKTIIPDHVEILYTPDQNSADIEKCLHVVQERKLFPCLIYGATGKESDHTLYNLNIIAKYSLHYKIIFHDSAYKAKEKYGVFVSDSLLGNLKVGSKISFISFYQSIISTKGLAWELCKFNLSPQTPSIRNSIKSNPIEVTVHSGNVLVLYDIE